MTSRYLGEANCIAPCARLHHPFTVFQSSLDACGARCHYLCMQLSVGQCSEYGCCCCCLELNKVGLCVEWRHMPKSCSHFYHIHCNASIPMSLESLSAFVGCGCIRNQCKLTCSHATMSSDTASWRLWPCLMPWQLCWLVLSSPSCCTTVRCISTSCFANLCYVVAGSYSKRWFDWPVWTGPEDQDSGEWTARIDVYCVVASGTGLLG